MAYTPTTWNTGDDVTATKLNKIENGIANAGGYDLVIASRAGINTGVSSGTQTTNDWSIITGSIDACEEKLENNQPVNAIVIIWDQQWSIDPPNDMKYFLPLTYFHAPYCLLRFGGIVNESAPENNSLSNSPAYIYVNFKYDSSTKALTHAHYNKVSLSIV